jgi:hypothetical protein
LRGHLCTKQVVILNGVCGVKNPEKRMIKTEDGGILRCVQNDKMNLVQRFTSVAFGKAGRMRDGEGW